MVLCWPHVKHVKHVLYINELNRKKKVFTIWITGRKVSFFCKHVLEMFWFLKETHIIIKNTGCINMFSCDINKISNCKLRRVSFFLLFKFKKSSFKYLIFVLRCGASSDYQKRAPPAPLKIAIITIQRK